MRQRVAIVEDDPHIRANYADVLAKHGYEVVTYGDARGSAGGVARPAPRPRLLDIGSATRWTAGSRCAGAARSVGSLPIIFLTARDGDFDTVSGLRMGATTTSPRT
jgi:two-component system OmpR family response regulator